MFSSGCIYVCVLGPCILDIPPPTFCPLIDLYMLSVCHRVRASQLKCCAYEITGHSSGKLIPIFGGFPISTWKGTGLNTCQQSKSLADGVCRAEGKKKGSISP